MSDNLENIWENSTVQISTTISEKWLAHILQKYNEDGRDGHNFFYLIDKFKEFDEFKHLLKNAQSFIFALFFQYLEYNPKDVACHEKNLQSFYQFAKEGGITNDSQLFNEVKTLLESASVHSTEEHKIKGAFGSADLHYFLDLDMYILGSSKKKYSQYINNIHNEYSFLDEKSYKNLRKKVLQSFLLIPNIFATKYFREKYEEQARRNIQEELNNL